jgi:erythritol transport system permease protein
LEANESLAAAASEERAAGSALVASGDRDSFQLALRTTILYPPRGGEIARIGPDEVRRPGIRVGRTRIILFVLAGLAAGVSGVMVAAQFNGDPKVIEEGWEFSVIVAAVLGGTCLSGGKGLVLGTVVGAAIVGVMSSGRNIMEIDDSGSMSFKVWFWC